MTELDAVQVVGRAAAGVAAVVVGLLMLVVGDAGAWNTRLALFLLAALPGGILLDQVRRAVGAR